MSKMTFSILTISALVLAGCAKEGLDGDATLVVKPKHHGTSIASTAAYQDSVFIKFGAQEIPSDPTRDYDALIVGEVGDDFIRIENVKQGDYSIYCAGWDTSISERVTGGVIKKIKRSERKNEIELEVPVVE